MEKKCKIVSLEGKQSSSPIWKSIDPDYGTILHCQDRFLLVGNLHLYFLSDEEIKVGDWVYIKDAFGTEHIQQVTEIKDRQLESSSKVMLKSACKKIIISTDPPLNLPRPSNEFLKAYCREGGIDEVMVEFDEHFKANYTPSTPSDICTYWKPKVAPDNTATIRKIKDSWSREEVVKLCELAWDKRGEAVFGYTLEQFKQENI